MIVGFASQYLNKNRLFGDFVHHPPREDLKFIVVIPCYYEDRITQTLDSLRKAKRPRHSAEIIVVINSSQQSSDYILQRNRQSIKEIETWRAKWHEDRFSVHTIHVPDLPREDFGAGLARKIGMDEAISRFNRINRKDGCIISLDADTTVEENYFEQIERAVENEPELNAGILYYEHSTGGDQFSGNIYDAVARYELFLRYYNQSLRWTGFPYAFHTIGSAFFVNALAYVKQGGMIRRKAGEDFYFLNKIFQLGNIREINSTTVYPSPRLSNRVLFGTGPEVAKITRDPGKPYMTYNFEAFRVLKEFFSNVDQLFHCTKDEIENQLKPMDPDLRHFLHTIGFEEEVRRINDNCKRPEVFRKHFFQWFGGLKVIRYMHEVHERNMLKVPIEQASIELFRILGRNESAVQVEQGDPVTLLQQLREIERSYDYRI